MSTETKPFTLGEMRALVDSAVDSLISNLADLALSYAESPGVAVTLDTPQPVTSEQISSALEQRIDRQVPERLKIALMELLSRDFEFRPESETGE